MARLRFPGRPGCRFDRLGIRYGGDDANVTSDPSLAVVASIHEGLKLFRELVGDSDEDEEFTGFTTREVQKAEKQWQKILHARELEGETVATRSAQRRKSLDSLPTSERTRGRLKTVVRKSFKDIVQKGLSKPGKLELVAKASDIPRGFKDEKPKEAKPVTRVDRRQGRIVKVATLKRIDLKGNRLSRSLNKNVRSGFVQRAPKSLPTKPSLPPPRPSPRPVGRPRKVPLEPQPATAKTKTENVDGEEEKKTAGKYPVRRRQEKAVPAKAAAKGKKKVVCLPKNKQVDKHRAKKLLEKAKKGPGRPVKVKAAAKKEGGTEGEESTVHTPHHKKQFILPLKSSRSSRVIKPNKRFIQDDLMYEAPVKRVKIDSLHRQSSESSPMGPSGQTAEEKLSELSPLPPSSSSFKSPPAGSKGGNSSSSTKGHNSAASRESLWSPQDVPSDAEAKGTPEHPLIMEGKRSRKPSFKVRLKLFEQKQRAEGGTFCVQIPSDSTQPLPADGGQRSPLLGLDLPRSLGDSAGRFSPGSSRFSPSSPLAPAKLGVFNRAGPMSIPGLDRHRHDARDSKALQRSGNTILRKAKLQLNRTALNRSKAALARSLKAQMKREAKMAKRHPHTSPQFSPRSQSQLSPLSPRSARDAQAAAQKLFDHSASESSEQVSPSREGQGRGSGGRPRGRWGGSKREHGVCAVCEQGYANRSSTLYYGVPSCDSCRQFYQHQMAKRAHTKVLCKFEDNCEITPSRHSCTACRLRKCRQVFPVPSRKRAHRDNVQVKQESSSTLSSSLLAISSASPMTPASSVSPSRSPAPSQAPPSSSGDEGEIPVRDSAGPRIKHVCRRAAMVMGKPTAKFPSSPSLRLSALPSQEKERLLKDQDGDSSDNAEGDGRLEGSLSAKKIRRRSALHRKLLRQSLAKPGRRRRKIRCRECKGCLAVDCGKCMYCLDKPKFGGKSIMKQACINRRCSNPRYTKVATESFIQPKRPRTHSGSDDDWRPGGRGESGGGGRPRGLGLGVQSSVVRRDGRRAATEAPDSPGAAGGASQLSLSSRLAASFSRRHLGVAHRKKRLAKKKMSSVSEGRTVVLQPSLATTRQWVSIPVDPHLIKAEFKEEFDVETAWDHGVALTMSAPAPVRALCYLCGSAGKHELVYCNVCCEPFHLFCLEEGEVPAEEDVENWVCARCQFCHVCGQQNSLLRCDRCHATYHPECLGPNYPTRPSKRKNIWVCTKCVRCKSCGATTPGNGTNATWTYDFSLCYECGQLMDKGNFCPICHKCYTDDDWDSKMVQCAVCESWVHSKCEGLTDEMYNLVSYLPEDVPYTCRNCSTEKPAHWELVLKEEFRKGLNSVLNSLMQSKCSQHLIHIDPQHEQRLLDRRRGRGRGNNSVAAQLLAAAEESESMGRRSTALPSAITPQPSSASERLSQTEDANDAHQSSSATAPGFSRADEAPSSSSSFASEPSRPVLQERSLLRKELLLAVGEGEWRARTDERGEGPGEGRCGVGGGYETKASCPGTESQDGADWHGHRTPDSVTAQQMTDSRELHRSKPTEVSSLEAGLEEPARQNFSDVSMETSQNEATSSELTLSGNRSRDSDKPQYTVRISESVLEPLGVEVGGEDTPDTLTASEGSHTELACSDSPTRYHPPDFQAVGAKLESRGYTNLEEFTEDMVHIIQTALNNSEDTVARKKNTNSVRSIFVKHMERTFPWFNVNTCRIWEHNKTMPSGMLPGAVLPPTSDHTYAQWLRREAVLVSPQPSPFKRPPSSPLRGDQHADSMEHDAQPMELVCPGDDARQCAFCGGFGDDDAESAGRLIYAGQDDWVHVNCALWSAEVFEEADGSLQEVSTAVCRGRWLKCDKCGRSGATVGCCNRGCTANFHFLCARLDACRFQEDKKVFCRLHYAEVDGELVSPGKFGVLRRVCVDLDGTKNKKWSRGVDPATLNIVFGSCTVESLGHLAPLSDCRGALLPVDFICSRIYWSTQDARKRCVYTCRIVELKKSATPLDTPEIKIRDVRIVHDESHPEFVPFGQLDLARIGLSPPPNSSGTEGRKEERMEWEDGEVVFVSQTRGTVSANGTVTAVTQNASGLVLREVRASSEPHSMTSPQAALSPPLVPQLDLSRLKPKTLKHLNLKDPSQLAPLGASTSTPSSAEDDEDFGCLTKIVNRLNSAASRSRRQASLEKVPASATDSQRRRSASVDSGLALYNQLRERRRYSFSNTDASPGHSSHPPTPSPSIVACPLVEEKEPQEGAPGARVVARVAASVSGGPNDQEECVCFTSGITENVPAVLPEDVNNSTIVLIEADELSEEAAIQLAQAALESSGRLEHSTRTESTEREEEKAMETEPESQGLTSVDREVAAYFSSESEQRNSSQPLVLENEDPSSENVQPSTLSQSLHRSSDAKSEDLTAEVGDSESTLAAATCEITDDKSLTSDVVERIDESEASAEMSTHVTSESHAPSVSRTTSNSSSASPVEGGDSTCGTSLASTGGENAGLNLPDLKEDTVVPDLKEDTAVSDLKEATVVADLKEDTVVSDLKEDTVVADLKEDTVVSDLKEDTVVADLKEDTVVSDLKEATVVADLKEDTVVSDLKEATVVADLKEDTVVPDLKEDTVVSDLKEATVVSDLKEDTVVPDLKEDTVVPDLKEDTVVSDLKETTVVPDLKETTVVPNLKEATVVLSRLEDEKTESSDERRTRAGVVGKLQTEGKSHGAGTKASMMEGVVLRQPSVVLRRLSVKAGRQKRGPSSKSKVPLPVPAVVLERLSDMKPYKDSVRVSRFKRFPPKGALNHATEDEVVPLFCDGQQIGVRRSGRLGMLSSPDLGSHGSAPSTQEPSPCQTGLEAGGAGKRRLSRASSREGPGEENQALAGGQDGTVSSRTRSLAPLQVAPEERNCGVEEQSQNEVSPGADRASPAEESVLDSHHSAGSGEIPQTGESSEPSRRSEVLPGEGDEELQESPGDKGGEDVSGDPGSKKNVGDVSETSGSAETEASRPAARQDSPRSVTGDGGRTPTPEVELGPGSPKLGRLQSVVPPEEVSHAGDLQTHDSGMPEEIKTDAADGVEGAEREEEHSSEERKRCRSGKTDKTQLKTYPLRRTAQRRSEEALDRMQAQSTDGAIPRSPPTKRSRYRSGGLQHPEAHKTTGKSEPSHSAPENVSEASAEDLETAVAEGRLSSLKQKPPTPGEVITIGDDDDDDDNDDRDVPSSRTRQRSRESGGSGQGRNLFDELEKGFQDEGCSRRSRSRASLADAKEDPQKELPLFDELARKIKQESLAKSSPGEEGPFKCPVCKRLYRTLQSFTTHSQSCDFEVSTSEEEEDGGAEQEGGGGALRYPLRNSTLTQRKAMAGEVAASRQRHALARSDSRPDSSSSENNGEVPARRKRLRSDQEEDGADAERPTSPSKRARHQVAPEVSGSEDSSSGKTTREPILSQWFLQSPSKSSPPSASEKLCADQDEPDPILPTVGGSSLEGNFADNCGEMEAKVASPEEMEVNVDGLDDADDELPSSLPLEHSSGSGGSNDAVCQTDTSIENPNPVPCCSSPKDNLFEKFSDVSMIVNDGHTDRRCATKASRRNQESSLGDATAETPKISLKRIAPRPKFHSSTSSPRFPSYPPNPSRSVLDPQMRQMISISGARNSGGTVSLTDAFSSPSSSSSSSALQRVSPMNSLLQMSLPGKGLRAPSSAPMQGGVSLTSPANVPLAAGISLLQNVSSSSLAAVSQNQHLVSSASGGGLVRVVPSNPSILTRLGSHGRVLSGTAPISPVVQTVAPSSLLVQGASPNNCVLPASVQYSGAAVRGSLLPAVGTGPGILQTLAGSGLLPSSGSNPQLLQAGLVQGTTPTVSVLQGVGMSPGPYVVSTPSSTLVSSVVQSAPTFSSLASTPMVMKMSMVSQGGGAPSMVRTTTLNPTSMEMQQVLHQAQRQHLVAPSSMPPVVQLPHVAGGIRLGYMGSIVLDQKTGAKTLESPAGSISEQTQQLVNMVTNSVLGSNMVQLGNGSGLGSLNVQNYPGNPPIIKVFVDNAVSSTPAHPHPIPPPLPSTPTPQPPPLTASTLTAERTLSPVIASSSLTTSSAQTGDLVPSEVSDLAEERREGRSLAEKPSKFAGNLPSFLKNKRIFPVPQAHPPRSLAQKSRGEGSRLQRLQQLMLGSKDGSISSTVRSQLQKLLKPVAMAACSKRAEDADAGIVPSKRPTILKRHREEHDYSHHSAELGRAESKNGAEGSGLAETDGADSQGRMPAVSVSESACQMGSPLRTVTHPQRAVRRPQKESRSLLKKLGRKSIRRRKSPQKVRNVADKNKSSEGVSHRLIHHQKGLLTLPQPEAEEEVQDTPLVMQRCHDARRPEEREVAIGNRDAPRLLFEVSSDDGFECTAPTMEEAWKTVTEKVQDARAAARMKQLSYSSVVGLRMFGVNHLAVIYLIEQLYGARHCHHYKFAYHSYDPTQLDMEPAVNESGCIRSEPFDRRKASDMFSFLMSRYRQPPQREETKKNDEEMAHKSSRRATSMDLPMAMRFRKLQDHAKEAVGVYRSKIHGRGLFCKRKIDAGEMVIEYAGEVIRASLTDKREKYYESKGIGCYMFRIDDMEVVDATMHGNAARFINHSCEPNCYSKVIQVDGKKHIVIFAMRPIKLGEELTYDYKFPIEEVKILCTCGSKRCRKYLN